MLRRHFFVDLARCMVMAIHSDTVPYIHDVTRSVCSVVTMCGIGGRMSTDNEDIPPPDIVVPDGWVCVPLAQAIAQADGGWEADWFYCAGWFYGKRKAPRVEEPTDNGSTSTRDHAGLPIMDPLPPGWRREVRTYDEFGRLMRIHDTRWLLAQRALRYKTASGSACTAADTDPFPW